MTIFNDHEHSVVFDTGADLPFDFVLALTGYRQDPTLFEMLDIDLQGDARKPRYDETTMETNVPGVFLAGTADVTVSYRGPEIDPSVKFWLLPALLCIPIIVLTANKQNAPADVLDASVWAVIGKPFDLASLLQSITTCLEQRAPFPLRPPKSVHSFSSTGNRA